MANNNIESVLSLIRQGDTKRLTPAHDMRKVFFLIVVFLQIYVDKVGFVPTKNKRDVHALGSQSPLGRKGKVVYSLNELFIISK